MFTTGEALIIHDAYADPRFNRSIDEQTGFVTHNILCVPDQDGEGRDHRRGADAEQAQGPVHAGATSQLLEAMTTQGTLALQSAQFIERMKALRKQEMEFVDVVSEVTADIKLGSLLQKVMGEATRMLNAERSTLFLNDEKTNELWSEVGQGLESVQIRLPNHLGIAGAVFTSGKTINIPYAYADLRFNPAFDKKTGFFTRSILCVPVVNKHGKTIGVTQVLNKRGGPFTGEDESRLRAFTAQVSIALENAKLFADVQTMKNYNEAMLESMSNGVVTLDEAGKIATCNAAGLRILQRQPRADPAPAGGRVLRRRQRLGAGQAASRSTRSGEPQIMRWTRSWRSASDKHLGQPHRAAAAVSMEQKRLGSMLLIEDISNEKRLKSTMSRYMDPGIADQLLASGAELLGGQSVEATVLFSDIRSFTTITEQLGAQGTVALLNEYFTLMVDCIQHEGGHARQVHRRRHHGRRSAFPVGARGRRRPRGARGDRHDARAAGSGTSQRVGRGQAAGRHRHRPQHRHRWCRATSARRSAWTTPSSATA